MPALDERLEREWELEREDALDRARGGLLNFIRFTMPGYEVAWHHRLICRAMNDLVAGTTRRLIVTMPPRHGKSQIISRHLPAYVLGRDPDTQVISSSYSANLAKRMSRDVQRIITCAPYRELFPATTLVEKSVTPLAEGPWVRTAEMFEVVGHRGYYLCSGIGGSLTGSGGDVALIDDPIKNWAEAHSETFRERVWDWYTSVLYTRLSKNARIALTLTRWHEDDLAGRLIQKVNSDPSFDAFRVINLPAIKDTPPDEEDPRDEGEALWPERFPAETLDAIRRNSSRVFDSLYQGRPSPAGGNVVKRSWWRFYDELPPPETLQFFTSSDLTFDDGEKNDYTVHQIWARRGADRFLVHQMRARMDFVEQERSFLSLAKAWPKATAHIVEKAANGAALRSRLRSVIPGIVMYKPTDSKLARAESVSPQVEAGNVYLPQPSAVPWVEDFIQEWSDFPNGRHDDQVDATSQALLWCSGASYLPAGLDLKSASVVKDESEWRG